MELNELKALMAANLLGGQVKYVRTWEKIVSLHEPSKELIDRAVYLAGKIWEETLRQDHKR